MGTFNHRLEWNFVIRIGSSVSGFPIPLFHDIFFVDSHYRILKCTSRREKKEWNKI